MTSSKPKEISSTFTLFRPLGPFVWICVGVSIVILTITLVMISHLHHTDKAGFGGKILFFFAVDNLSQRLFF